MRKIKRAVDLMLCLFPFETDIYRRHAFPVRFVGHPLADEISAALATRLRGTQLGLAAAGQAAGLAARESRV